MVEKKTPLKVVPLELICENCIHWEERRNCNYRQGYCLCKKTRASIEENGLSYTGSLITGPKFGCIHHQKGNLQDWIRSYKRRRLDANDNVI